VTPAIIIQRAHQRRQDESLPGYTIGIADAKAMNPSLVGTARDALPEEMVKGMPHNALPTQAGP
jgi:hypothetical protein